jgi:hypothetical protein
MTTNVENATMKVEVSIGEAVDKLSILNIKLKNIEDPIKINEIKKEIESLNECGVYISKYPMYYNMMIYVNEQIWNKTDLIKIIGIKPDAVNREYAAIAHSIFELNQQRFRIKNFFNILCNSNIKEQKSYASTRCHITIKNEDILYDKLAYINYLTIQYDVVTFNFNECNEGEIIKNAIKRIFYAPNIVINSENLLLPNGEPVPITHEINLSNVDDELGNMDIFEFEPIRYAAGGMFGDFIHSLSIINEIFYKTGRKGLLYISDKNGGDIWRFGILETYQDTYSVIKSQKYIKDYKIYESGQIDINLNDWRKNPLLFSVPLYESYNFAYKSTHGVTWGERPWLNVKINPIYSNILIINTTNYRWAENINFNKLISEHKECCGNKNGDDVPDVLFLSSNDDSQYKHFIATTGINIPTILANTFQEMCTIIASCKLFAGSASGPMAIATAFDKKRIIGTPNTVDRLLSKPFTANGIEGFL